MNEILWFPRERLVLARPLEGRDAIMAEMGLSWSTILRLVETEGLPVKGLPDHPTLEPVDLADWSGMRPGQGKESDA